MFTHEWFVLIPRVYRVGWGFIAGASQKDIVMFLFEQETVDALAGNAGVRLGGQGEVTLGPWGRQVELYLEVSNGGVGGTAAMAFTRGAFGGVSVEGAIVAPRQGVNDTFYGRHILPEEILFECDSESNGVRVPEGTAIDEVYAKLDLFTTTHMPAGEEELETLETSENVNEASVAEETSSLTNVGDELLISHESRSVPCEATA